MCGLALRPLREHAARTIFQTHWRVIFRAPRPTKSSGELFCAHKRFPALGQIFANRLDRRHAQRHDALLVAFAAHQHVSQVELQVFQLDADHLRDTQRAAVERLQHGAVAQCDGGSEFAGCGAARLEQGRDLVPRQRLGQHLPLPRRFQVERGVVSDVAVEQQVLVEVSQGGELARHRTSVDMVGEEMVEKVAHVLPPRSAERPFLQEAGELGDVARVGCDGERRQPLLDLEVVDKRDEFLRDGLAGRHAASMRVIGRGAVDGTDTRLASLVREHVSGHGFSRAVSALLERWL